MNDMKVVVDTTVFVDFLRTKNLQSLFVRIKNTHQIVVSLITIAELYSGKSVQRDGPEMAEMEKIIQGVEVVIPDINVAKEVGKLRAQYDLSLADAFIAALAIESGLPLATLNKRDFAKVKELELFQTDDSS